MFNLCRLHYTYGIPKAHPLQVHLQIILIKKLPTFKNSPTSISTAKIISSVLKLHAFFSKTCNVTLSCDKEFVQ